MSTRPYQTLDDLSYDRITEYLYAFFDSHGIECMYTADDDEDGDLYYLFDVKDNLGEWHDIVDLRMSPTKAVEFLKTRKEK